TDSVKLKALFSDNGYGSNYSSSSRSDFRTKRSNNGQVNDNDYRYRSGSYSNNGWSSSNGAALKLDMGLVLLTDEYYPQLVAGVTNLAFPRNSYSSGNYWNSHSNSSGSLNRYRSNNSSWSGGGSSASSVPQNV